MLKINTLVWLGAGEARTQGNRIESAKRVLLVEARGEAVAELQHRFSGVENVEVVQATVASERGKIGFNLMNVREYSAISQPKNIKELFPSLKIEKCVNAETSSVAVLLSNFGLEQDQNNHLVIDIQDQAHNIIEAMNQAGLIGAFKTVEIQLSEDHYHDSASIEEVEALLVRQGFELKGSDAEDLDFPVWSFNRNPLWSDFKKLEASQQTKDNEITELQRLLDAEKSEGAKLKEHAEALQQTKDNEIAELQRLLDAEKSEGATLKVHADELSKDLAGLSDQIEQIHKTNEHEVTEMRQELREATEQKEGLVQKVIEQDAEIERLSTQATARLSEFAKLEDTNRRLSEDNKSLSKRQGVIEREISKAQAQVEIIKDLMIKPGVN